ncbi:MAG: hypothetical protein MZV63_27400 [Marinilabiliales bacterium]|nr:hypothetical protein [Marinilabiliales bacterium]
MSSYHASGQYYNKIICDPKDVDQVYQPGHRIPRSPLTAARHWQGVSNEGRHVDDHAMWIDPDDTKHFYIGGDGGIYETWDNGENFIFKIKPARDTVLQGGC